MRIKRIRVQNLRAVKDCTLALDGLTALVGPNGAGKSTFLHALMLFQGDMTACKDDYHNRDTTQDISIQITFTDLPNAVMTAFPKYTSDNELGIKRIIRWKDDETASSLHGCYPGNPDFEDALDESDDDATLRYYVELFEMSKYSNFPELTSASKIRDYLRDWVQDNPDKYNARHDDEALMGDGVDGAAYLKEHVYILYIPAVRDAAAGKKGGGAGSVLGGLLDETTKNAFARTIIHQDSRTALKDMTPAFMRGEGLSELDELKSQVTKTLESIVPGSQVKLEWHPPSPDGDMPRAEPRLAEDEYVSPVGTAGHGLQRAFVIMAALRQLPWLQNLDGPKGGTHERPSVVLAVEEPEIYQHPTRMRHLAGLFRSMSQSGLDGVADRMQVVYTTHSPYFVGADRIGQVRMLRKVDGGRDKPKTTRVWRTDMDSIRKRLVDAGATRRTDPGRLEHDFDRILTPMMSEGFFADRVVLVEGDTDRIAVMRAAEMLGTPLDERGVAVISCGPKGNLHAPLAMFKELGVRTYVVWDGDNNKESEKKNNACLLSLLGMPRDEIDAGAWLGAITPDFACCEADMECMLRSDMGEEIHAPLAVRFRREYGLSGRSDKKPLLAYLMMREMEQRGMRPERLGRIVEAILDGSAAGGSSPA